MSPSSGPKGAMPSTSSQLRICMVSDFFFPGVGGVETVMYQLSQSLMQRGHKVVVVTPSRGRRKGVRWMANGLKVYYLPFVPFTDNVTFPTFCVFFPILRQVLLREQIDIVHGHQTTSSLAHQTMFHARTMGLCTVYTEHSLFNLRDLAGFVLNRFMAVLMASVNAQHVICVSHVTRENFVLRTGVNPSDVSVIPNAVDAGSYTPDPSQWPAPPCINIVFIGRLTYRKGVHLLIGVMPVISKRHSNVRWIIGGDGPKMLDLRKMIESEALESRVEVLGSVAPDKVRDVLARGHVFLNTSLTESFCIANIQASSCGLLVVSTSVGGVPEVLPPHMARLAKPDRESITAALADALRDLRPEPEAAWNRHEETSRMYSWQDVAQRTETVYERVLRMPRQGLRDRLRSCLRGGPIAGKFCMLLAAFDYILYMFLEWLQPRSQLELAYELLNPRASGD